MHERAQRQRRAVSVERRRHKACRRRVGDIKAVFGSWGLRNARPLALHRKERPPRAPLHEQRKKATLNAAHGRRHTAASAGVSRPTADKKFFDLEVHDLHAIAIGVVAPPKVDAAVGDGEQPVVGERDAVGVAAEVGEHMFRPGERRLAVDDPTLAGGARRAHAVNASSNEPVHDQDATKA